MINLSISFFSYGLLIFAIAKLPEKFWDKLLNFYSNSLTLFKKKKKSWPLLGEIYRGEELLIAFSECEARISLGLKMVSNTLPKYKFYTDLLDQLFELNRKQGIGIKKFIPEIRLALIRDLQFEKKVFDEIVSGFMQFLVIAATTWSFVFLSSKLVEIPLNKGIALMMLVLEIIGSILFFQMIKKVKFKSFSKFSKAVEELYLFTSLIEVGLPLNEVLLRSNILQGSLSSQKTFENLSERMRKLISRMKENGLSPKDEAQEIIREIWHLQEVYFQKFTKIVQLLKFSILAFFFLPAYFLYLYSIFKFFMEQ